MTTREFLRTLNGRLSYRMLDYWIRNGYVTVSADGAGPGSHRNISAAEAAAIRDIVIANEQARALLDTIRTGELFARRLAHHRTQTVDQ